MKKFFCRTLLSLLLATTMATTSAQTKPLKVGDTIPDELWNTHFQVVNDTKPTMNLAEHRDKLIILDFWATWCSACLLNFPVMEELQEHFGDKIKIIPVTDQDKAILQKFYASKNGQKFKSKPSIVQDTTLDKAFPHLGVPFMVWIKDGKILSTTDATQVNKTTISEILTSGKNNLQTVTQMSRERPLMLSEAFDNQKNLQLLHFAFFSKGYIPDIGGGGTIKKTPTGKVYRHQYTNVPLTDIYSAVAHPLFKDRNLKYSSKKMKWETNDTPESRIQYTTVDPNKLENLYSVDYAIPENSTENLYEGMFDMLAMNGPFHIAIEKRNVECLILYRTSTRDKLKTKGAKKAAKFYPDKAIIQNYPIDVLVNLMNGDTPYPIVINETNYTDKVDMLLPGVSNLEKLQPALQAYDVDLKKEIRSIDMLIISNHKSQPLNQKP